MLNGNLSTATAAEVAARLSRPDLGRWIGQVEKVRHCSNPVRLSGTSDTISPVTGEVFSTYTSAGEPDGVTYVRCGNRRQSVCPSCSHEYKGDVWHVLMAGAAGGMKDVPATVAAHPLVFATMTAPSFGTVHAAKKPGRPGSRRCLPRSGQRRQVCPHGRRLWCMAVHDHTEPTVGQPLCPDCYDYASHLVWQWWAPELWRRFTIALRRRLAHHLGMTETAARQLVRVQFAKVAEFQRRGLVHFHALIRLDGSPTGNEAYPAPAVDTNSTTLSELVLSAARSVSYDAPLLDVNDQPRRLRFGAQLDARPVTGTADRDRHGAQLHPETVAAYIAKYATKAAGDLPQRHQRRERASAAASDDPAPARPSGHHRWPEQWRAAVPRLGPLAGHARLPRPPRHQVAPLLCHSRPASAGPPRVCTPPHQDVRADCTSG